PLRCLCHRWSDRRRHRQALVGPAHRQQHNRSGAGRPALRLTLLLAAASSQQRIGIAVAVLLVVGWAVYVLIHLRTRRSDAPPGAEYELAPNRKPYYDDDFLETKKLDRSLGLALVLLVVVAIGLPLYWANE